MAAPMHVPNLSFPDDIVTLQCLMNFLHHYEAILSQLISQLKSSFYVMCRASVSYKGIVQFVTSFRTQQFHFSYLACLVYVGCVWI